MITLTSFQEARGMEEAWSGARWAPDFAKGWKVVEWAQPLRPDGSAIKLRDFGEDPLPKYKEYVLGLYRDRWPQIKAWLELNGDRDLAIACWCPHTKVARRQIEQFGTFHCHLGVVYEVLKACGVDVVLGAAHEKGMVK